MFIHTKIIIHVKRIRKWMIIYLKKIIIIYIWNERNGRNGKMVWKVAWTGYYLRLNLSSEDTSAQATSAYISCKHWICGNVSMVKTTVLFTRDQHLGPLIHFNFIILILIYFWSMISDVSYVIYGCSSARTNSEVSLYWSFLTLEKNIIAVITQNREMNDNLERQIKNKTFCTCRLFLLT